MWSDNILGDTRISSKSSFLRSVTLNCSLSPSPEGSRWRTRPGRNIGGTEISCEAGWSAGWLEVATPSPELTGPEG